MSIRYVSLWDLTTGEAPYRPAGSPIGLQEMVRAWDDRLVGTLRVAQRPDGVLFVVDGQRRVLAARKKYRGEDVELLCDVATVTNAETEAQLLLAASSVRRKPVVRPRHSSNGYMVMRLNEVERLCMLRIQAAPGADQGQKALAMEIGREHSETSRALLLLERAGLIEGYRELHQSGMRYRPKKAKEDNT